MTKKFFINISTFSFIVWAATIVYFIFSVISHQNTEIWSQKDSNILLIDILIGIGSFPLAILRIVIFLSDWFNKSKQHHENTPAMNKNRSFNPWFAISMILFVVLAYLYGKSESFGLLGKKTIVTPTIAIQPTITSIIPSSTPIPKKNTNYNAPTTDPDPYVNCNFAHLGKIIMRESECKIKGECEINGKYVLVSSGQECNDIQGNSNTGNNVGCQKVQYTTKQGITNGTFYCCSDKVNEISRFEQQIQISESTANSCYESHKNEIVSCISNCTNDNTCTHNCAAPFLDQCGLNKVGDIRTELMNKIRQYCP